MTIQEVIAGLREVGLSNRRLAHILGVHERQVQRWADGLHNTPRDRHQARLLALEYVADLLSTELGYPDPKIERWLYAPCRELGGEVPVDMVRAGRHKAVIRAVEKIVAPVADAREEEVSA